MPAFVPSKPRAVYSDEQKAEYRRGMLRLENRRLSTARKILREAHGGSSLDWCHRPDCDQVPMYRDGTGVLYLPVKSCGSWSCPVCGARNAYKRAQHLKDLMLSAQSLGWSMLFITLTVRHDMGESCAEVSDRVLRCNRRLLHDMSYLLGKFGYQGVFRCLDYTHRPKVSGVYTPETVQCHAHLHCVWFFDHDLTPDEVRAIGYQVPLPPSAEHPRGVPGGLAFQWERIHREETGREALFGVATDLQKIDLTPCPDMGYDSAEAMAMYVAKGISIYATTALDKASREAGVPGEAIGEKLTPMELLDHPEFRDVWLDWAEGIRGRKFSFTSRGLARKLGLAEDEDDCEGEPYLAGFVSADCMAEALDEGDGYSALVDDLRHGLLPPPVVEYVARGGWRLTIPSGEPSSLEEWREMVDGLPDGSRLRRGGWVFSADECRRFMEACEAEARFMEDHPLPAWASSTAGVVGHLVEAYLADPYADDEPF